MTSMNKMTGEFRSGKDHTVLEGKKNQESFCGIFGLNWDFDRQDIFYQDK